MPPALASLAASAVPPMTAAPASGLTVAVAMIGAVGVFAGSMAVWHYDQGARKIALYVPGFASIGALGLIAQFGSAAALLFGAYALLALGAVYLAYAVHALKTRAVPARPEPDPHDFEFITTPESERRFSFTRMMGHVGRPRRSFWRR